MHEPVPHRNPGTPWHDTRRLPASRRDIFRARTIRRPAHPTSSFPQAATRRAPDIRLHPDPGAHRPLAPRRAPPTSEAPAGLFLHAFHCAVLNHQPAPPAAAHLRGPGSDPAGQPATRNPNAPAPARIPPTPRNQHFCADPDDQKSHGGGSRPRPQNPNSVLPDPHSLRDRPPHPRTATRAARRRYYPANRTRPGLQPTFHPRAPGGRQPRPNRTHQPPGTNPGDPRTLLRKEVIQPHLPVRLPCYDFVPIADPTFDGSPHKG